MMQLRLIRNATLRLDYAGVSLLIDPMLGVVGSVRALGGVAGRNPTVELPCPVTEVLDGIDGVIVSHVHPDHFDDAAFGLLRRNLPILCQSADVSTLNDAGFTDVVPIVDSITWKGLRLTATPRHAWDRRSRREDGRGDRFRAWGRGRADCLLRR
jgi:L-ascorbate metabolism protein UlaG (beta-lactamase superfamily)